MANFNMQPNKNEMPMQDPIARGKNFSEVALGYTLEMALDEANRCLECKNPSCVKGCPVNVDIPGFIAWSAVKFGLRVVIRKRYYAHTAEDFLMS